MLSLLTASMQDRGSSTDSGCKGQANALYVPPRPPPLPVPLFTPSRPPVFSLRWHAASSPMVLPDDPKVDPIAVSADPRLPRDRYCISHPNLSQASRDRSLNCSHATRSLRRVETRFMSREASSSGINVYNEAQQVKHVDYVRFNLMGR